MKNYNLRFKTNINCSGCVSKVRPLLDAEVGIGSWEVDTANKDKILTISAEEIAGKKAVELLNAKGFKAEPLHG